MQLPAQDIWTGMGGSGKAGWDKGSLVSTLARFLAAVAGVRHRGGGTGRWAMSPLKFGISLIFAYFLRS